LLSTVTRHTSFRSLNLSSQWIHLTLILLAGTAVYINSLNVPFVLDDVYNIRYLGGKGLGDLLLNGGARRFADITFALNYQFFGLQVNGYHVTNLVIHLATAITLYFLTQSSITALRSTATPLVGALEQTLFIERFLPLATALLFVSHPIQTQAVTYTVQRYTSLATFFYLVSVLAFVKARVGFEQHGIKWNVWIWGWVTVLAALLAIGTKQIAITLPFMLILLEVCLFRGHLLGRRFMIGCGVLLMLVSAVFLYQWQNGTLSFFLYDLRHATTDDYYASRTTYFFTQLRVIVTYLRLLCLPINQSLFYDYPIYTSLLSFPVLASATLHVTLITTAFIMLRMSRQTLTSADSSQKLSLRLAALGIFWFYLTLAVESSFIPIRDIIVEHRIYLPSAGFFIAVSAVVTLVVRQRHACIKAAWLILVIICLVLSGMTIKRNRIWSNSLSLWQNSLSNAPNNGLVLANLANEYMSLQMADKALPLYVHAIEVKPNLYFRSKIGLGFALQALNISGSRFTTGQEFMLPGGTLGAGTLDPGRYPEWEAVISNNMGLAYEYLGELVKARSCYDTALSKYPAYDRAWYNLGTLAERLGDTADLANAIKQLQALNPNLASSLLTKTKR